MKIAIIGLLGFALAGSLSCSRHGQTPPPGAGVIAADPGGAAGYRHGIDRSKFSVGVDLHYVNELGFQKVVGSEGVFAVDPSNGLAVAIPNAHSARAQRQAWFSRSPEQHNQLVVSYFLGAGILKEQVGAVHATMSLAANARGEQVPAPQPKIGGYQSILDRKVSGIPVVDSVAWARLDDEGMVVAEWVYWPAIPGKVIAEASRMRESLATEADQKVFLARLPDGLPPGRVVIRHSSATSKGPLVAMASYDIDERRFPAQPNAQPGPSGSARAILITRHFGGDGKELRLPQEQWNIGEDYPMAKRPPATPHSQ